jgi:hypothetical protein
MAFLILVHAVLGAACLFLRGLPVSQRSGGLRFLAAAGALAGALLFAVRGSSGSWGTMEFSSQRLGLVAIAIFCGWLLVLVGDEGDEARWDVGALVGAGGTALGVLATTRWIAPALLFWVALSLASLAIPRDDGTRSHFALTVGLSDALFVGGLVTQALTSEAWSLPSRLEGAPLYLVAAAVIVRAGIVPVAGVGAALGRIEGAMIPLLVGSAFGVLSFTSGGGEIIIALPLLLYAAGAIAWSLIGDRPHLALVVSWPVATMLAIAWIAPGALARAGATSAIAVALVSLWPSAAGRAQSERGLVLAALPATVGFGAIVAGAAASFHRAVDETSVLAALPWDAFAALLPVVLAGGVALGASIGRRTELEHFRPVAVLSTWVLALAALLVGLAPASELGLSPESGPEGRAVPLIALALIAGVGAARFAPKELVTTSAPRPAPPPGVLDLGHAGVWVGRVSMGVFAVSAAAALWLTYAGLAVGFL